MKFGVGDFSRILLANPRALLSSVWGNAHTLFTTIAGNKNSFSGL